MNGLGYDIDGKKALPWKKKRNVRIGPSSGTIKTKKQLINAISKSIKDFSQQVYGSKDDQKYRRIVDLIMLRMTSDLEGVSFAQIDLQSIKSLIEIQIENAFNDADEHTKYYDVINQLADNIICIISGESSADNATKKHKLALQRSVQKHSQTNQLDIDNIVNKANELICSLSIEVDQQFTKLEQLVMSHFAILSPDIYDSRVIETVDMLKSLQLGSVQIPALEKNLKSKSGKSKKLKSVDIVFAGMKFNSKMIEGLSSSALNSIMQSILLVKKRNDDIITKMSMIDLYSKENAKYTIDLLKMLSESDFMKIIKDMFDSAYSFFKKKFVDPLVQMVLKFVMSKIPQSWIKLYNKVIKPVVAAVMYVVNHVISRFKDILNAFAAALKLAWKALIKVFMKVKDWIVKTIQAVKTAFVRTVTTIIDTARATIVGLVKAIIWIIKGALKLAAAALRWVIKTVLHLMKYGFDKLMQSSFGQMLKNAWNKFTEPFKKIGHKIAEGFRKMKRGFTKAKNALVNKVKKLAIRIKNRIVKVVSSVKKFFGKAIGSVRSGLRKIGQFLGNHIKKVFNKIPGVKYIKALTKKVFKMIGKKLFKKKAEDLLKKRTSKSIIGKIIRILQKYVTKMAISAPTLILTALTLAWTIYDLFKTYREIKTMLKPMAQAAGYDTERPAWFEIYLMEEVIPNIGAYIIDQGFFKLLSDTIGNLIQDGWRQLKYDILTADLRWEIARKKTEQWKKESNLFDKRYIQSGINEQNIDNFIDNQFDAYKNLIKTIYKIKEYNDKLNRYNEIINGANDDEIKDLEISRNNIYQQINNNSNMREYYASKLQEIESKIRNLEYDKEDANDLIIKTAINKLRLQIDIVKYASRSGLYTILNRIDRTFGLFVGSTKLEYFDDFIAILYKEAYSGIKYLEMFKHKREIDEQLRENVKRNRRYHLTHEFNQDEVKRALKDIADEREKFKDNANEISYWLDACSSINEFKDRLIEKIRYMFKLEDDEGRISDYNSGHLPVVDLTPSNSY